MSGGMIPDRGLYAVTLPDRTRLGELDAAQEIPRFDLISKKLRGNTGWEVVPVPGLIPDDAFFTHLANRRFPVTVWLRRPEEFDYIVEPDVFHDFFGHVPLLFDRTYADHLYEYGKGGLKAMRLDAVKMLIELGLDVNAQADTGPDHARGGKASADQLRGCGIHVKISFQIL